MVPPKQTIEFSPSTNLKENLKFVETGDEITIPVQNKIVFKPYKALWERVALGYIMAYDWILENQPENARYYLWAAGSFSQEVLRNASDKVREADLVFTTQG